MSWALVRNVLTAGKTTRATQRMSSSVNWKYALVVHFCLRIIRIILPISQIYIEQQEYEQTVILIYLLSNIEDKCMFMWNGSSINVGWRRHCNTHLWDIVFLTKAMLATKRPMWDEAERALQRFSSEKKAQIILEAEYDLLRVSLSLWLN